MIPREQAWLRVLARPGKGNKEGLSLCPSLSVLRTFRRIFTGQRSTPSFALQSPQFPRLLSGDISPKVATPFSVPLTVEMFACATSTAHYHHTCQPLISVTGGANIQNLVFILLLMTFYDPVQEYQTVGWSQKTTLHHVIMMGETYSRDVYISQYSSRALVQNYLPPGQRRKLLE